MSQSNTGYDLTPLTDQQREELAKHLSQEETRVL